MIVPELAQENRIDYDELATLVHLSLQGLVSYEIKVSCSTLADDLGVSSQTASRRLQNLERAGLVVREPVNDGQFVTLTPKGYDTLEQEYERYREIFEGRHRLELLGTVAGGLDLSRHVLDRAGYAETFEQKLQFRPHPEQLTVALDRELGERYRRLNRVESVTIEGWHDGDRRYDGLRCHPARLAADGESADRCYLVTSTEFGPEVRSVRLIAPGDLRADLGVEDGDEVRVSVGEER